MTLGKVVALAIAIAVILAGFALEGGHHHNDRWCGAFLALIWFRKFFGV